jgi:RNA polymerase sigma-70 factor (ECF subfamily)
LLARYEKPLFNVALRMLRDREDARDATQTAFVRAWEHLGHYDRRHKFFSWIYRILFNEAINRLRRRRTEPLDDHLVAGGRGPEEQAEQGEVEGLIQDALKQLSEEGRQVIVLRHWLDLSYEAMAEMIGIPEKTVKSRLFTARQKLGEILTQQGVR